VAHPLCEKVAVECLGIPHIQEQAVDGYVQDAVLPPAPQAGGGVPSACRNGLAKSGGAGGSAILHSTMIELVTLS